MLIGTVAGGSGVALLHDILPGESALTEGIAFGVGSWLVMMLMVMPMSGAGLFGLGLGIMAPIMSLMLHIVVGLVLGAVYPGRVGYVLAA